MFYFNKHLSYKCLEIRNDALIQEIIKKNFFSYLPYALTTVGGLIFIYSVTFSDPDQTTKTVGSVAGAGAVVLHKVAMITNKTGKGIGEDDVNIKDTINEAAITRKSEGPLASASQASSQINMNNNLLREEHDYEQQSCHYVDEQRASQSNHGTCSADEHEALLIKD